MYADTARLQSDNTFLSKVFDRIQHATFNGEYEIQASSFEVDEQKQARLRTLGYTLSAIDHDQIRISW